MVRAVRISLRYRLPAEQIELIPCRRIDWPAAIFWLARQIVKVEQELAFAENVFFLIGSERRRRGKRLRLQRRWRNEWCCAKRFWPRTSAKVYAVITAMRRYTFWGKPKPFKLSDNHIARAIKFCGHLGGAQKTLLQFLEMINFGI